MAPERSEIVTVGYDGESRRRMFALNYLIVRGDAKSVVAPRYGFGDAQVPLGVAIGFYDASDQPGALHVVCSGELRHRQAVEKHGDFEAILKTRDFAFGLIRSARGLPYCLPSRCIRARHSRPLAPRWLLGARKLSDVDVVPIVLRLSDNADPATRSLKES
jgi:hypothetical protein